MDPFFKRAPRWFRHRLKEHFMPLFAFFIVLVSQASWERLVMPPQQ
jgi:hypothetical protein